MLGLFAVQHSVMARPAFKRWWTRVIPPEAERSTYTLLSSIALIALFAFWQPVGGVVWNVTSPLGVGLAFWCTPTMTVTHLVFAIATTAYILVAIQLEERDLIAEHPEYAQYRQRVPMLVPFTTRRRETLGRPNGGNRQGALGNHQHPAG